MSPEAWSQQPYSLAADVWSLGCLLYELAALRPAFTGGNARHVHGRVVTGRHNGRIPEQYSEELWQLICGMLVPEEQRPSMEDIMASPPVARRLAALGGSFPPPSRGAAVRLEEVELKLDLLENIGVRPWHELLGEQQNCCENPLLPAPWLQRQPCKVLLWFANA